MAGFGLRIARSQGMEGFTGNTFEYPIDPTNTNVIFTGDAVTLAAGGTIEEVSGNTPGPVASPANGIAGVFTGCRYVAANGDYRFERYWDGAAGSTNVVGSISMPAHSRFYVKGLAGTNYQQSSIGDRYDLNYAAGSVAYGDSRMSLGAANAAGLAQIQRLAPLPGNEWGTDEPILEISIVLQAASAADIA